VLSASGGSVPIRRVRKAYEQVADQLRELIISGQLGPAQRLPNEAELAAEFGVSRPTVREALRVLSAASLIRSAKGASGGTFVTVPTVDHIQESLSSNISLLSQTEHVSIGEFLEARELLEVPAARLAAQRRSTADIETLRAAIPAQPLELSTEEQFIYNKEFHSAILVCSGNTLLSIATHPIFSALQANLKRSALGLQFHQRVNDDHRALVAAIEAGDGVAAADQMEEHLRFLRPMYEEVWRYGESDPCQSAMGGPSTKRDGVTASESRLPAGGDSRG
jgi:GntR family transcriptional regulator, transcriptional repressor for pyruvate dehydrogenase complex